MREIPTAAVTEAVSALFLEANAVLPASLEQKVRAWETTETNPIARGIFSDMCRNLDAAREKEIPICQDTGMAVLFCEIGQEVHFTGGNLREAIDRGVHEAYLTGKLRCSIVKDPLQRENTGDNTPALIHFDLVPGDRVTLTAAPKGFGSENMSRLKMFTPSAAPEELIAFVAETVLLADANPCPPVVLGVGIGSDFEGVALLAKKALCRDIAVRAKTPFYRDLEERMLQAVNATKIGAQGFGGDLTAFAVNIETAPTHIAGLPMAVNVGCHVTRHASMTL